jgi:hypothetical protein
LVGSFGRVCASAHEFAHVVYSFRDHRFSHRRGLGRVARQSNSGSTSSVLVLRSFVLYSSNCPHTPLLQGRMGGIVLDAADVDRPLSFTSSAKPCPGRQVNSPKAFSAAGENFTKKKG